MLDLRIVRHFAGFSLDVSATSGARVIGLFGPSGSGKTTLLRCIAGITDPDEGWICIHGATLFDSRNPRRRLPVHARRVGLVFQDGLLFPHYNVERNLRYGLNRHGPGPSFADVVHALDLKELLIRSPETLSGGEMRRAAIARAILSGPSLLMLDEPLNGLDRSKALRTLAYIAHVLRTFQIPAIYVSHAIGDVLFVSDEVWHLDRGRLVAQGAPAQVITQAAVLNDGAPSDSENIFVARRVDDTATGASTFVIGDQRLVAHQSSTEPLTGPSAILSIRATDLILSCREPQGLSARNRLKGRVTSIVRQPNRCFTVINVGVEWIVELTPQAVDDLSLTEGVDVWAIVKASAITVLSTPTHMHDVPSRSIIQALP